MKNKRFIKLKLKNKTIKANYLINNIIVEKLDETHDTSEFSSKYEKLNKFLKEEALALQDTREPMTILMKHKNEIIGYYSTGVPKYDITKEHIEEMVLTGALPKTFDNFIPGEIRRFVLDKKYDKKKITLPLFARIYGSLKLIMRKMATDEPVGIIICEDCKIPATKEEIYEEIRKMNRRLKDPKYEEYIKNMEVRE